MALALFARAHMMEKHTMAEAAKNLGAVCLDGTPGVYYFSKGYGSGTNKWLIHHEGGGWCESLDDCVDRSKTVLGSSSSYPEEFNYTAVDFFSRNSTENPTLHNWNQVAMKYCDGASFSGDNETVTIHNGTKLHFRGSRVRQAIAQDLFQKMGMSNATEMVVAGGSAGGLATFLHLDQWCDLLHSLQPSAKCVGLPDSGFFVDYQDPTVACQPDGAAPGLLSTTINGNYHCGLWWTFHTQNASAGINQRCIAANQGQEWKCMFAENAVQFLHAPLFALQSQYDSWQIAHVQGWGGSNKTAVLGKNVTERLIRDLLGANPKNGAFLDSCYHHCGMWNYIRIDGDLVSSALQKWYYGLGEPGNKRLWNQNRAFPCYDCCWPSQTMQILV